MTAGRVTGAWLLTATDGRPFVFCSTACHQARRREDRLLLSKSLPVGSGAGVVDFWVTSDGTGILLSTARRRVCPTARPD